MSIFNNDRLSAAGEQVDILNADITQKAGRKWL